MRRVILILVPIAAIVLAYCIGNESIQEPSVLPPPQISTLPTLKTTELVAPSTIPCPEDLGQYQELEPLEPGPARFEAVSCMDIYESAPATMSSDGKSVAFWGQDRESYLSLLNLRTDSGSRSSNRVAAGVRGPLFPRYREDALSWRSDGLALWSIEQELQPGGWAISGLTPILIEADGKIQRFTPLQHEAGPLDRLAWVDDDGLAIAEFGTRGNFYRPQRDNLSPTLAIVDVPSGSILDSITSDDAEVLRLRAESNQGLRYSSSSSVRLPDGRVRVLLSLGRVVDRSHVQDMKAWMKNKRFLPATLLVWTQGEKPAAIPISFDFVAARAELTPDGGQALVWRPLQPDGVIHIECFQDCPPLPAVTPVNDTIAALVSTETGQTLWKLKATASEAWNSFGGAAISPTGEFALIALPAAKHQQMIALLSMKNGRILQRFSLACNGCYPQSFGFVRNGDQMWIAAYGKIAFYDLK